MKKTPKGNRLHLGIFGRTNVGKSSFLNVLAGQDIAITSPVSGTTTDVVEKNMELLPIGPVVILDTAGLDDTSMLSKKRIEKTKKILKRSDIIILVTEPNTWTDFEENILNEAKAENTPVIIIVNKIDIEIPTDSFIDTIRKKNGEHYLLMSCVLIDNYDSYINNLKQILQEVLPMEFINPPPLVGDLINPGGIAVLVVPIDLQAPKGRLILPQVQTIRDILDNDGATIVVKERELKNVLDNMKIKPDIVIGDSQIVLKMCADVPNDIKCTTFSILFARLKGDLVESARGAAYLEKLMPGDKVLIAEACSHHPLEDDIGRVKIPRWIRQYVGADIEIDSFAGHDYPDNLNEYSAIVHCGGCMITRKEMLNRIKYAKYSHVPITNYGVAISFLHGVLRRTLAPFPAALEAYERELNLINMEV